MQTVFCISDYYHHTYKVNSHGGNASGAYQFKLGKTNKNNSHNKYTQHYNIDKFNLIK